MYQEHITTITRARETLPSATYHPRAHGRYHEYLHREYRELISSTRAREIIQPIPHIIHARTGDTSAQISAMMGATYHPRAHWRYGSL